MKTLALAYMNVVAGPYARQIKCPEKNVAKRLDYDHNQLETSLSLSSCNC